MNSSFKIRPAFKAHFSVKLQSTILSFDAKHMLKIELITRKRSSNPFQKNPHLPSLSENLTIPTFQKTPTRGNRLRWPENRSENRYTRLDYRRGFKMAIAEPKLPSDGSSGKVWSLCRMPFWQTGTNSSSSSQQQQQQLQQLNHNSHNPHVEVSDSTVHSVSSVARSFLPGRRRLRLDPANKLYFPYEPGKQVRSAIRIKNTSRSHVAFKFQTTQPKCCFMRPPGGILSPGESIIATVFKFVEHPENNNEKQLDQKSKVKFKIVSLKVKEGIEYVPELFDEQKDQVAVEQILRVVFLEAERPTPQLEKLNRQLAEAEAALEARKKPPEDTGPRIVGEGLVIDEWKERRERYLARQQVEGVDSV